MAVVGFIACGFSTWLIFQKRTELAIRTLEETYTHEVEQSLLRPDEKAAIVEQLEELTQDLKRGKYENWQAAGVMQRLVRLPVLQWGELHVIDAYLRKQGDADAERGIKQLSRLRRAVELNQVTAMDVEDVLDPATVPDDSAMQRSLIRPLTAEAVAEVVQRAKLVANRSKVPDKRFENVRIEAIVRRQIEQGLTEGSY